MEPIKKQQRGFAIMKPERQKEIASMGGAASPGNFKNDPERAKELGKKGGSKKKATHE